jgi:uncharacterized protein
MAEQLSPVLETPPPSITPKSIPALDLSRIAQDLQIRKLQVESVVQLLDEGNTVPFITRYRKERTGGLNEDLIRIIQHRVAAVRSLADRKQTILRTIENQGKLTEDLRAAILAADNPKRLEDLYLPYKPKKRSPATIARERGLEPLALSIWNRDPAVANLVELLPTLVNPEKELNTADDVLQGVVHILAEQIAETADIRAAVRAVLWETGKLCTSRREKLGEHQGLDYKDYFQFTEPIRHIPPHRILAINRGEKEGALQVRLEFDAETVQRAALDKLPLTEHPHIELFKATAADALTQLLLPSLEREIRRELTMAAEDHAVDVFARNLRSLLLAPPLHQRRVLAIDPGFRTGCKLAALDESGNLLEDAIIYPFTAHPKPASRKGGPPPAATPAPGEAAAAPDKKDGASLAQRKRDEAKAKLEELIRRHCIQVIAIGNGTACRETEELISELISDFEKRRTSPRGEDRGSRIEDRGSTVELPVAPEVVTPAPSVPLSWVVSATITADQPPPETEAWLLPAPATEPPCPMLDARSSMLDARSSILDSLPEPLPELAYVIVNEAGASVYSASPIGREEFPNFDATLRGTISIGRRLQDPLSELVKVDPQNIGVGLYQHDVHPRYLKESLEAIIESCVNHVGVDLNTASVPLLRHVSGLNALTARELVEYRKQHGAFRSRDQLLQVQGIGETRYVQAAGFLKILDSDNPLDRTWIHPESYPAARQLLAELGYGPEALASPNQLEGLRAKLKELVPEEVAARLQLGVPTVRDLLDALARPGRDPREDLPPPIFKKGILKLEDLQPGMELKGTVLNVVDFGAFIDIGLKDSGLVHISQMANRYIKSPYEVVAVGDVATVWVLTVDHDRRRVSLTMIKPGTQRKPPERRPPPQQRGERSEGAERRERAGSREPGSRPPRGRRPGPGRGPGAARRPVGQKGPAPQEVAGAAAVPEARKEPVAATAPPPRTRRPQRSGPKPKLSQAALEGRAPLRTFGELAALLEAKQKEEPPPPPRPPDGAEAAPPST